MKLTKKECSGAVKWMGVCLIGMALALFAYAQAFSTTTVQGTVYLANGTPGAGTLQLSWPAFTTSNNQAVTAGRTTVTIGVDGFVSVNLAPNQGAMPGGLFYTANYYMSDGTTSTEYWVVPTAAQTSIAQVRAQVMPAAQAVHAVNKAYVDQAIQSLSQSYLAPSGGTLSGPLFLNSDPSQAMQAADKHYVDSTFSLAVPLTGANMTGPLTSVQLGAAYQADQFTGADFGAKLQACLGAVSPTNGGTCDARNFTGNLLMASNLIISTANTTVMLPCATISTAHQVIITAGTRNVALRGCALRGASNASGSQGGTVFLYSGAGAMVQVGDPTYTADTLGFHLDNAVINTTASTISTAQALTAYRTQEMDLQSLYFLGNSNQTGMTLDGTGNYTGGTFYDNAFNGFQTAVNAIGHQVSNTAVTDWLNASTFVRLHIDCPTSAGNPISGTYGINLLQGDGNTFTGGDVEGCDTALHLGTNAQNNTIVGLRNENSNNQVVADSGSSYNNWMTGGTMFTGKLADNGTRNSFLDTFHRSFNGMNGDWYGSQQDATVTNHFRIGTGTGNERGLLNRYQTDSGYRWTTGLSDATAGEQFYQVLDELNNVYRLSIGQYNVGQSGTNDQTVINAAGTGAVVLNGSNSSGTGGVVIGSGGSIAATVATISNAGNALFNGSLQVGGTSTFAGSTTVRNQADAEIDSFLWAGATADQKESMTYKDYTGTSQWYMVKDASNNWALNSASGGLDSIKAYQSTNSGDTYIDASNPSGVVRVNYETGAGTGFNIYGGNSSTLYAGFTGSTAIKFPGLAASSGHDCLQIDNSGYMSNTGSACGSGNGSGTVNSGSSGQIAYYSAPGTAVSGMSAVPVAAGGTGATSAGAALTSLGGASLTATGTQIFAGPINFGTPSTASATLTNLGGVASAPSTSQTVTQPSGTSLQFNGLNQFTKVNDFGDHPSLPGNGYFGTIADFFASNTYTKPFPAFQSYGSIGLYDLFLDGGVNENQDGLQLKPGVTPFSITSESHSGGSTNPIAIANYQYGLGDTFGIYNLAYCYGGTSAAGDEGCENADEETFQGNVDYNGPITAGSGMGSTSVTVNPSQGAGTQGAGRWLLDLKPSNLITSGTISAITKTTYSTYTGSGTSWPVSTVNTTLGTAVTNTGTYTVSPASMTGITTSTVLCLQDAGNFQTVIPTATTGTTFTAYFNKPQLSTAMVTAGGLCGYYIGINADKVAPGNGVTGTLLYVWPVIRSTSPNSMDVWINHAGAYATYAGAWSSGDGTYTLYPGAEVLHVANGGTTLSNTLTLAPSATAWATGDTVDQPLYPDLSQSSGFTILTRYLPTSGNAVGRNFTFGPYFAASLGGIATGIGINNQTASSYYNSALNRIAPTLFSITGVWNTGLNFQNAPNNGAIAFGSCSLNGCGTVFPFTSNSPSGAEYMEYNQAIGDWYFTTGFTHGGSIHFANNGSITTPNQLISTIATGTAPLAVTSTTPVANLSIGGSAASGIGTISNPFTARGGSGATTDFQVSNAAGTATLFAISDNGNATLSGTATFSSYLSSFTQASAQYFKSSDGNWEWFVAGSDPHLYLRDNTNGIQALTVTQGAGHAGSVAAYGTLSGYALQAGSAQQTTWDANGIKHEAGSAPVTSAGTVTGTNAGGYISGLSASTSVTITFANSGWATWASCVANASTANAQPYVSSISKTAVTFSFASLTGTLYYHCDGN